MLIIFGAILATFLGIWKENWFFRTDVQAHLINLAIYKEAFEVQFAVVNIGNRQGLLSNIELVFLPRGGGFIKGNKFTIDPYQILLNPGDIRFVSVTGTLPLENMYLNGVSVDPHIGNQKFVKEGERKADVALSIQGLDFQGRRYDALWKITTVYLNQDKSVNSMTYYENGEGELSIFDSQFLRAQLYPYKLPVGAKVGTKSQ